MHDDNLGEPHRQANYLGTGLFNLLMPHTQGSAYTVTRSMTNEHGCETVRLPKVQYVKTKICATISTLIRIMLQKLDETKFVEQLMRWEFDIAEYERVTAERLPELLKTTLLFTKISGPAYGDLGMQVNDANPHEETIVVKWCRTISLSSSAQAHRHARSRGSTTGPAPMETDTSHNVKGRGKGQRHR